MSEHDEGLCGGNHSSLSARQRAERYTSQDCPHDPEDVPSAWLYHRSCIFCLTAEIEAAAAEAIDRAAKKAQWKASTIGIIDLYQDGRADDAGKALAAAIRSQEDET